MRHALAHSGSWYEVGQQGQPLRHRRRWDADGKGSQAREGQAACASPAKVGACISGPSYFSPDFGGQDPRGVSQAEASSTEGHGENASGYAPKAMAVCAVAAAAVACPAPAKKKRQKVAR